MSLQECAEVHFVAERIDGSTVAFSSSRRTHIDKQNHITRKDQVLAFRLAAGWEVRGRWQAFQYCVFVNISLPWKAAAMHCSVLPRHGDGTQLKRDSPVFASYTVCAQYSERRGVFPGRCKLWSLWFCRLHKFADR